MFKRKQKYNPPHENCFIPQMVSTEAIKYLGKEEFIKWRRLTVGVGWILEDLMYELGKLPEVPPEQKLIALMGVSSRLIRRLGNNGHHIEAVENNGTIVCYRCDPLVSKTLGTTETSTDGGKTWKEYCGPIMDKIWDNIRHYDDYVEKEQRRTIFDKTPILFCSDLEHQYFGVKNVIKGTSTKARDYDTAFNNANRLKLELMEELGCVDLTRTYGMDLTWIKDEQSGSVVCTHKDASFEELNPNDDGAYQRITKDFRGCYVGYIYFTTYTETTSTIRGMLAVSGDPKVPSLLISSITLDDLFYIKDRVRCHCRGSIIGPGSVGEFIDYLKRATLFSDEITRRIKNPTLLDKIKSWFIK